MKALALAVGVIGLTVLPRLVWAQAVDDPFSDYLQRSQGIAVGAGNANDTNEVIQTITPWPAYVGDRRIPIQGRRGVDAVERMYRVPDPFVQQGAGTGAAGNETGGASAPAGSSPTGALVTPMQPISSGN
jgi:hypothetical protein